MKEYTILQAAQLCGVSKNTIKYRLKKIPADKLRQGEKGIWLIPEDVLKQICKEPVQEPQRTTEEPQRTTDFNTLRTQVPIKEPPFTTQRTTQEPPFPTQKPVEEPLRTTHDSETIAVLRDTVAFLKAQIEIKDKQLADLSTALVNTQQALTAAQALHAGTMKQIQAAAGPAQNEEENTVDVEPSTVPTEEENSAATPSEKPNFRSFTKSLFHRVFKNNK